MTLRKTIDWLFNPPLSAPSSTILIRLMAGGVFLSEGILKFVYVNQGVGRFTKIGIPAPAPMAHFVAILEIVGGLLLVSGFLTRLIAIPFVIEMIVAILSTKVALYLGTSPLPMPPAPPQIGIWAVLHESRSDYAQIMSVLFLLIAGPGPWSLDGMLALGRKRQGLRKNDDEREPRKISAVELGGSAPDQGVPQPDQGTRQLERYLAS